MTDTLTIRRPDDWHVHLRDDAMLTSVAPYTARQFARAIVMPNLPKPITTVSEARAYRDRVRASLPDPDAFTPLMTCYLTDYARPETLVEGHASGVFTAAKLYPAHATTNAAHGVTDVRHIHAVLEAMQRIGMPLLIHGEVTDPEIDIFDREAVFIDRVLSRLVNDFPALKIVFEHITTSDAADFVTTAPATVAATITPHHLMISRNAMFAGGIRPHAYCLPIAKRERHRLALRKAAISGSPKFFLGTDSAPHARAAKESACGCAGIFNAPVALECYATVFDEDGALDRLEGFASEHGAHFYGLPLNTGYVTLTRRTTIVDDSIAAAGTDVIPFCAGQSLPWSFAPGTA